MQPIVRDQGVQDYQQTWQAMVDFTKNRHAKTPDEVWIVEHFPVYTFGLKVNKEHLLHKTSVPIVKSDRGGQITYHGFGQLILYVLLDLKRLGLNIRELVTILEQAMISALSEYGLIATAKKDAPGVYINQKKIGSIGLRVKKNGCYHGLSLNNTVDLIAFETINPCGFRNLKMTKLEEFDIHITRNELAVPIIHALLTAIKS
jgi:lipoyl(octanoyl) transferase